MADLAPQAGDHATMSPALCLELTREVDGLKASLYLLEEGARTLRGYERYPVDWGELEARCATLVDGLNLLAGRGVGQHQGLVALERVGAALFDALLSPRLKERLAATGPASLLLSIDDGLVHIPWELLFDGESFLCLRHAVGRVVRTEQAVPAQPRRDLAHPLRALILADPQGDLASAYSEGRALRDTLAAHPEEIEATLKTTAITLRQVRDRLREADLVHFAGHAAYHQERPSDSGWVLKDATLSPQEIRTLAGGARPLPSLIFSNACQSGQTSAWRAADHFQEDIFGLANAFLLAGVRHYVGTFFDIPDEASATLAIAFYDRLLAGAPVGEALRVARQTCIDRYGLHHPIWASYMLYGDPAFTYRAATSQGVVQAVTSNASVTELARARAQLDARLAARSDVLCVMFADLVGSITYFEDHGDVAGRAWVQQFRDRFAAVVQRGGGQMVKSVGDGVLATFSRTDDAVAVARRLLEEEGRGTADVSQRTQLRLALHRGTLVVENDDVMGDTVNVVCRLVDHATPGEALVSREAAVALATPIPDLDEVGVRRVRGREAPVHLYRLQVSDGAATAPRDPVVTRSAITATPADLSPEVSVPNRFLILAFTAALAVLFLVVGVQRGILPFHGTSITPSSSGSHAGPMVQALSPAAVKARDRLVGEGIDRERSGDLDGAAAAYRQGLDVAPGDPYLQAFATRLAQRMAANERDRRQRRIEALSERIAAWKGGQGGAEKTPFDPWTSRPLTFAFLGFKEVGDGGVRARTAEYLGYLLADGIREDPRIGVVERELLDALLDELQISSTELVDQAASLPIGRLLAARVLGAGRLFYLPDGMRVTVRLFDAETGLVLAARDATFSSPDQQERALARLATALRADVAAHYPLRARVARVTEEGLVVDAGYRAGVQVEQRFAAVLGELDSQRVVLDTDNPLRVREVREAESVLDVGLPSRAPAVGQRLQVIDEVAR